MILLKPNHRPEDPEITCVGFYPTDTVDQMAWRALHFTFDVSVQLIHKPDELLFHRNIVCIEEYTRGADHIFIDDFQHPESATYITGNSQYRWPSGFIQAQYRVFIPVPKMTEPLYGQQAQAIVLYDRMRKQHGNKL